MNDNSDAALITADEPATSITRFQINSTKLYVPVVTLSINHHIKFLEHIKEESKRTVSLKNIDLNYIQLYD